MLLKMFKFLYRAYNGSCSRSYPPHCAAVQTARLSSPRACRTVTLSSVGMLVRLFSWWLDACHFLLLGQYIVLVELAADCIWLIVFCVSHVVLYYLLWNFYLLIERNRKLCTVWLDWCLLLLWLLSHFQRARVLYLPNYLLDLLLITSDCHQCTKWLS